MQDFAKFSLHFKSLKALIWLLTFCCWENVSIQYTKSLINGSVMIIYEKQVAFDIFNIRNIRKDIYVHWDIYVDIYKILHIDIVSFQLIHNF